MQIHNIYIFRCAQYLGRVENGAHTLHVIVHQFLPSRVDSLRGPRPVISVSVQAHLNPLEDVHAAKQSIYVFSSVDYSHSKSVEQCI